MHYVTSHYASSPRDGTFPVMLPAQLMFRVTIPTILETKTLFAITEAPLTIELVLSLVFRKLHIILRGKGRKRMTTSGNTSCFRKKHFHSQQRS